MAAEVGILVTAKDAASQVLKGIQTGAKKTTDAVKSLSDKAQKSFSVMGGAITAVNQGLEIGRKAWELMRFAVADTVTEALRFRRAGDPVLKWFQDMKRESELLRAAFGDALIPVVQGLAEGLGIVGDGATKWVQANRKLIATGILQWSIDLAKSLVKGVGFAVIQIGRAWAGWQQIIGVVQLAIGKFLSLATKGISKLLSSVATAAEAFGADGLASKIGAAQEALSSASEGFSDFGDEGADAALQAEINFGKLERKVTGFTGVALTKLDRTYAITMDRIAESTTGTTKTVEEQQAALERLDDTIQRVLARRAAEIDRVAAFEEGIMIALAEKEEARLEELARKQEETFSAAADVVSGAIEGIFRDSAKAADLMRDAQKAMAEGADDAQEKLMEAQKAQAAVGEEAAKSVALAVIDSALAQISAHAATAAAGAFSSQAGIPVIGPALGATAAAATAAAVAALGAGLKGAVGGLADGGVITGGPSGRDSQIFSLMRGEQVMSVSERAGAQKFIGRLLAGQSAPAGGGSAATGGSGRPTVINNINRTWVPNINEETRMSRRLNRRSFRRLSQQQMLVGQEGVLA